MMSGVPGMKHSILYRKINNLIDDLCVVFCFVF